MSDDEEAEDVVSEGSSFQLSCGAMVNRKWNTKIWYVKQFDKYQISP